MKNVVWWAGVKTGEFKEKYGGHNWIDISRKSWEFWCKQNDILFVPLEEPIEQDVRKYRINWQKSIFVFDELERRGIDYDQICLVDASSIIRWDAPNFFNLTERKFSAVRETDNMHWMLQSVEGYQPFFDFKLDSTKYFSSGFLVFNKEHRELFNSFKQLYIDNVDEFVKMQDETVRKGTEQTPLNYWVQKNNIEVNLLPPTWKLTHIQRKEMFSHNWQLQEDQRPFFMKYGYVWFFTGIAKEQRSDIMNQVWNAYSGFYSDNHVLNKVNNKLKAKNTTSSKFKEDLLHYFSHPNCKQMTVLELGSCRGDTTRVLAECFGKVISFERDAENVAAALELNQECSNVSITQADVYSDEFTLPDEKIDVAFIDAGHTTELVLRDINRVSEKYGKVIYIFDDFGQMDEVVTKAIYQAQSEGKLNISRFIGANAGFVTANGKKFKTAEGVICNI
jgi:SAM-dependent methyltransferase